MFYYNAQVFKFIITGAGQGIGKEITNNLCKEFPQSKFILVSKSENVHSTRLENEKGCDGIKIRSEQCDLNNIEDLEILLSKIKPDEANVIINCAGILGVSGYSNEIDHKFYKDTFQVNCISPILLINHFLKNMQKKNFGRIINFAGGGAAYGYPKFLPYALSKVSIVRATETLADEQLQQGYDNILFNCIAPGAIDTQMLRSVEDAGGIIKSKGCITEPVKLTSFLVRNNNKEINGRFIHSRDNYNDPGLFNGEDNLKLRRKE